jgi:hypothetical protein
MVERVHRTLKPGGVFWVSDKHGGEVGLTVLVATLMMAILPTRVSYADKLRGALKFNFRAPSRIQASMQSEGYSPFEGAGRGKDWPERITQLFEVQEILAHPAVTGYLAAQIRMPSRVARILLGALAGVDCALVRLHLLRSSGLTLVAHKQGNATSSR